MSTGTRMAQFFYQTIFKAVSARPHGPAAALVWGGYTAGFAANA